MANGELKGIIDEVPYGFLSFGPEDERLEQRLKSKIPIVEGEFNLFSCNDDSGTDMIKTLDTLKRNIIPGGKFIVQIHVNERGDDFGYAMVKLFENFSGLTKSLVRAETMGDRTYVFIKNQGVSHLACSSDAFDFYRRMYEYHIKPKLNIQ